MLRVVVVAASTSAAAPSKPFSRCRRFVVDFFAARPSSSSSLWRVGGVGGWDPPRSALFLPTLTPRAPSLRLTTMPPMPAVRLQIRPYVFLPTTFSELVKDVRSFLGLAPSSPRTKLVLKLKEKRTALRSNYDARKRKAKRAFESNRKLMRELIRRKGESYRARRVKAWNGLLRRNEAWIDYRRARREARVKVWNGLGERLNERRRKLLEKRLATVRSAMRRRIDAHYRWRRDRLLSSRLFGPSSSSLSSSRVGGGGGGTAGRGAYETETTIVLDEPSSKSWFLPDGRPRTSRDPATGRFVNPWNSTSTDGTHALSDVLEWRTRRAWGAGGGGDEEGEAAEVSPPLTLPPPFRNGRTIDGVPRRGRKRADDDGDPPIVRVADFTPPSDPSLIKLTWIGHSTVFVRMNGFTLLTDPMFSERASPIQCSPFGVARYAPPASDVESLPDVDVCLISHDHYDHCDLGSIYELRERNKVRRWVVPLGLKDWIVNNCGIEKWRVHEMEWWEEATFEKGADGILRGPEAGAGLARTPTREAVGSDDGVGGGAEGRSAGRPDDDEMTVACAPAQHWCGRTPFDRNRRLWCSFAVRTTPGSSSRRRRRRPLNFYFAGDTGLPTDFPLHRLIGDAYGPFDLSAIPVGAYEPRFFMKDGHCSPAEAVAIHESLNCRRSVGVHWGAFALADERRDDPPRRLEEAVAARAATAKGTEEEETETAPAGETGCDDNDDESRRRLSKIVDFVTIPPGGSVESPKE